MSQTDQLEMFDMSIGLAGTTYKLAVNRNVVIVALDAQQTSRDAAARIKFKTGAKRQRVYNYLLQHNATDEQIETALNMSGNTVRPTRGTLVKDGLVVDSGMRRLTRAGNNAIVWRANV